MKNIRRLPPIAYLLFTIVLVWRSNQLWQSIAHFGQPTLTDRRSSGERLLITEIDCSEKRSDIKSFANGDYNSAIEHFQASLKESRNDVQTRLYLQNTIAIQTPGDKKEELAPLNTQSVISVTLGSETEFKSVTESVTKQHQASQASQVKAHQAASLEVETSIVLPKGTKVRCTCRNWAGKVFAHRVKEFTKPNGTIERVLQYYVDFGDNKFQWRDGDILEVVPQADF